MINHKLVAIPVNFKQLFLAQKGAKFSQIEKERKVLSAKLQLRTLTESGAGEKDLFPINGAKLKR